MTDTLTIPRPTRQHRGILLVVLLAVVLSAPAALALWFTADRGGTDGPAAVPRVVFEQETGIRVTRIAVVGGGGIVDLRFQVLDPDKAIAVHDQDSPLVLVDEDSATVISSAFHGRHAGGTTQTTLNPAASYYLLFANSEGELRRGDRASVVLGDVRLEHVPVQ